MLTQSIGNEYSVNDLTISPVVQKNPPEEDKSKEQNEPIPVECELNNIKTENISNDTEDQNDTTIENITTEDESIGLQQIGECTIEPLTQ